MKLIAFCLLFVQLGCRTNDNNPLIPKDQTSEAEKKNTLFVFVGEKIFVQELPHNDNSIDAKFKAKYKILQRVYGNFSKDTIEFEVYDHYGVPGFSHYKNVLLFVSEYEGKYYHEKYQYFSVYNTKDGRWAGPYQNTWDYSKIKPHRIKFDESVYLPTDIVNNDGDSVHLGYSLPYYNIINHKAYPLFGNYVEELFMIKKLGVLKWEGLFGKGNENWKDSTFKVEDIKLAPIKDSE